MNEVKLEATLEAIYVPIDSVEPNPWNPNEQSPFIHEKTIISVLEKGMVDAVKVRELADGYQIVDGEHRWRLFKDLFPTIKRRGRGYCIEYEHTDSEGNPIKQKYTIDKEWADGLIPVYSYGQLSDSAAMELTLILNGTRGEPDPLRLGELIQELYSLVGEEETAKVLPYTNRERSDMLSRLSFDFAEFEKAQVGELEKVYTKEAWQELKFLVPPDADHIVRDELKRISNYISVDERLPRDIRYGLALVQIAKLSALTPTESLE